MDIHCYVFRTEECFFFHVLNRRTKSFDFTCFLTGQKRCCYFHQREVVRHLIVISTVVCISHSSLFTVSCHCPLLFFSLPSLTRSHPFPLAQAHSRAFCSLCCATNNVYIYIYRGGVLSWQPFFLKPERAPMLAY